MFGRWFEIADSMLSVCTDSVFVKYHWIYHEIWEFRPFNVHLLYSNKFTDNITEVMSVFALCVKNDYERVFFVSFFPLSFPYSFVFDPHAKINFGICLLVVLVVVNSFSFVGWQCNSAFWKLLYVILLFAVNNKKNVAFAMRQKWSPFVYSWACFMWWQNAPQLGNWISQSVRKSIQFGVHILWICVTMRLFHFSHFTSHSTHNIHILFMNYNFISFLA